jgi:hypothetical protein
MDRKSNFALNTFALSVASLLWLGSAALAQNAPPTYQGDPDVYKVIFEDDHFRVIEAIRKPGVHDKLHSHLLPAIVYDVTDCTTKLYDANGKVIREGTRKADTAFASPITTGHSAENTGSADCKQIFVERK